MTGFIICFMPACINFGLMSIRKVKWQKQIMPKQVETGPKTEKTDQFHVGCSHPFSIF